ncbi:protein of unknown function [Citrobacter amalonaticus]|uniref:Uncharacterized protein n=1 Tax=Citrobacter amalonaticus TaxID=35703 RepID=A0AAX2BNW2_CITAM|nr:protein of unknown function [Citrobacter amalonaticus]
MFSFVLSACVCYGMLCAGIKSVFPDLDNASVGKSDTARVPSSRGQERNHAA